MKKFIKKTLTGILIGTALLGSPKNASAPEFDSGYNYEIHQQLKWDKLAEEQNADKIKKPYVKTPSNYCSRYAVRSAKRLFDKEYNEGNAWDLIYNNEVVYDFQKERDVKEAIMSGKLQPGMLVTSKWPVKNIKKYGEKGFDIEGNPIEATHVIEYPGIGKITDAEILKFPEPIFFHKWGNRTERMTQKQLWDKYQLEFVKGINDKPLEENPATTFPEKYFSLN